jgi:putative transposase
MRKINAARIRKRGRRGFGRQQARRSAEQEMRRSVVGTIRWLTRGDLTWSEAAERIGLCPRTTRDWEHRWQEDQLAPRARGRPVERPEQNLRNAILSLFDLVGPEISELALMEIFPEVARAELRELKRRYREVWRRKNVKYVYALRWANPGSVWAMDFTTPRLPVDGIFPKVLAVRDLASARQLELLPAESEDAETACGLLEALIKAYGPPLVIKVDNGAAFQSQAFRELCQRYGILILYSPPYTPSYNGAVETGMGTLKTNAHHASVRNDRPGEWTCDDVEAARCRGNAYGRPHGAAGPTPDQAWASRMEITEEDRDHFRAVYEDEYKKEAERRGVLPLIGPDKKEKDSIDRHAISKALMKCGLLHVKRRRITPPVRARKTAGIS